MCQDNDAQVNCPIKSNYTAHRTIDKEQTSQTSTQNGPFAVVCYDSTRERKMNKNFNKLANPTRAKLTAYHSLHCKHIRCCIGSMLLNLI